MLDVELVTPPSDPVTDIVPIASLKKHLRISAGSTAFDDELEEVLEEVVALIEGNDGNLRRSIRPATYRRHLRSFPAYAGDRYAYRRIQLPYPPLIEVLGVYYNTSEGSPSLAMSSSDYIVRAPAGLDGVVGEIELLTSLNWPAVDLHPRAVTIEFRAGYEGEYPLTLRRMIKIMVGHYWENREATINESRVLKINRAVEFGMADLRGVLAVPLGAGEWEG